MNKHHFNFALPIISAIALPISSIAYSANQPSAIDVLNSKLQEINTLQDKLNEKLEELRVKQSEIGQHRQQLEEQLATQQRQAEEREAKLSTQMQELQQQLTAAQGTITELTTLEASTKQQTFKLGGDLMVFYPVFFHDHCFDLGNTQLTIYRYVHEDVAWKGGLVARISYHPNGWGAGADYTESLLTYSIQPFVADIIVDGFTEGVTYWLRGNTTYHYSTNCPKPLVPKYNLDGDIVLREHEAIPGGKHTRSKRTDVNPALKTGWTFSHDLHYPNQEPK